VKVLVDTSVWIGFLNAGEPGMADLLTRKAVDMHPFVIGELACGNLADRKRFLAEIGTLPRAPSAQDNEVLAFLEAHHLYGSGLSWTDAHLLASALISGDRLWTLDKPLGKAAQKLGIAF
jgi:predicted nucleic acid-binding protein